MCDYDLYSVTPLKNLADIKSTIAIMGDSITASMHRINALIGCSDNPLKPRPYFPRNNQRALYHRYAAHVLR